MSSIYDFSATSLSGEQVNFEDFRGKVLLIVNTASKCGFTPQYAGLEALHQAYHRRGLVIVGFPCNQFGKQEQGGAKEIKEFCRANYGVNFLMMDKICVNGKNAHPIYQFLKAQKGGLITRSIKWNFTKFLVDYEGNVSDRFSPLKKPENLEIPILTALCHVQS